jgi:site-specific DNA recombinase
VPRKKPKAAQENAAARVLLYRRVSAVMGRGGDDFHSPELQLSAMRRMTVGLAEVDVIDDIGETGRDFDRDGIDRIKALADARAFDVLAVYNVSRIGRNVLESLKFLAELAENGITIISASEQVDTSTSNGRWLLTQMLSVAQMQSDQISDGWSRVIDHRAQAGKHHGRPLGYAKVDKQLVPDPALAPVIAEVFERYADGVPIGRIAQYLAAARGAPTQMGNLKKILRNPAYLGHVVAAGEILPGVHEAIVKQDVWDRVQARLAKDAGAPAQHLNPRWSLVGLLWCEHGHRMVRQPFRERSGEIVYRAICSYAKSRFAGGCVGVGNPILDRVEQEVLRQVREYVRRLRTDAGPRAARMARAAAARADAAALRRELDKVQRSMVRLTTEFGADEGMPRSAYRAAMAELKDAEAALSVELSRVSAAALMPLPEETANAAEAVLALWPSLLPDERGQLLRSVVRRVEVRKAAYWREPEADRVVIPDDGGWV